MKDALVRLLSSAKFWTAIIALIAVFAAKYGFEISTEMTGLVAAIFAVLLGGQGLTDHGKAAALINNAAMVRPTGGESPPVASAPALAVVPTEEKPS